ncbi:Adenosylhomocysteinase [Camellia lanceoleosa]|uniref:Adenosylhomocysteinase n=1 Tax=Camellia lanceoleosa TaxID=1840588 RepID=A0ACC0FN04_9ERIC|nr:Adenosylhomocysteinase [Camellia lanceoleosa]
MKTLESISSGEVDVILEAARCDSGSNNPKDNPDTEEYQIQLALELSAKEDPKAVQIEAVKQISLGSCPPKNTLAEVVAYRYWVMKGANRRLLPFLECTHVGLWKKKSISKNEKKVYIAPKHLDEKVAALHLGKLGARPTKLSKDQSDYISIPIEGPYKPAHYSWEERNGFFKCWKQNQMDLRIISQVRLKMILTDGIIRFSPGGKNEYFTRLLLYPIVTGAEIALET